MGKKPLISSKILLKIETLLIIAVSFFLLNTFGKKETTTQRPEESIPQVVEETEISTERTSVFFDEEIYEIEKKMVMSAEKCIRIATYTYSKSPLTDLLEKRKNDGIDVKVVSGKNRDGHIPQFDMVVNTQKNGIYHPKFMVFDSKDVIISSSNISSERSASNSAVLFRDVPVAAKILENEIDAVFSNKFERRCETGCETGIGTIIFNPGKGCVLIKNEFLKAEKSIKAGVYTVTSKNPVITGLKTAIKKGVDAKLIFDNWKGDDGKIVNKKAFSYLSSKGANIKFDEPEHQNDSLFHHKFAVIDGVTTVFGSMNWTSSGCYRNREIIVINKDPHIAQKFEKYFDSLNQ
ncbi:MAG TPA: phospholipase D-like domain-containing protein [bacterium]|nr:phospholipase D-like domain-containing protein [bacterium]HQN72689.1 phospholipase D-like domain-containing protein [bacterium]HQO90847.1 phospholipase D-like domain-containing protein [bacterium]